MTFACLAESLEPCIQRRKHFRAVELFANAFHESSVFLLIGIHFDLLMFPAVATFLHRADYFSDRPSYLVDGLQTGLPELLGKDE